MSSLYKELLAAEQSRLEAYQLDLTPSVYVIVEAVRLCVEQPLRASLHPTASSGHVSRDHLSAQDLAQS